MSSLSFDRSALSYFGVVGGAVESSRGLFRFLSLRFCLRKSAIS